MKDPPKRRKISGASSHASSSRPQKISRSDAKRSHLAGMSPSPSTPVEAEIFFKVLPPCQPYTCRTGMTRTLTTTSSLIPSPTFPMARGKEKRRGREGRGKMQRSKSFLRLRHPHLPLDLKAGRAGRWTLRSSKLLVRVDTMQTVTMVFQCLSTVSLPQALETVTC